jgi:ketosteroid isomerase-like protein
MAAQQPDQVIEEFVKHFNAGDLDGLLDNLYEGDAVLVPEPGPATISGTAALREVLQAFIGMNGTMKIVSATAYPHGDIALTHSHWRLDVPDGEGMEGTTAEVVRRQPDGSWKYAIDNPWGGAVLGAAGS